MLLTGRMFTFKILSSRGRRLEVKAQERTRHASETREVRWNDAREAHENRFYSLSESAENSHWLRDFREDKCLRLIGEKTVNRSKKTRDSL